MAAASISSTINVPKGWRTRRVKAWQAASRCRER